MYIQKNQSLAPVLSPCIVSRYAKLLLEKCVSFPFFHTPLFLFKWTCVCSKLKHLSKIHETQQKRNIEYQRPVSYLPSKSMLNFDVECKLLFASAIPERERTICSKDSPFKQKMQLRTLFSRQLLFWGMFDIFSLFCTKKENQVMQLETLFHLFSCFPTFEAKKSIANQKYSW